MPATVADHITPHKGDHALFNGPLQSLCKLCHDSVKAREEGKGGPIGCDVNGNPLRPLTHWRVSIVAQTRKL